MKKTLFLALALVAAVLTSCNEGKIKEQQSMIDSLASVNNMTSEELQSYIDLVNSISESIDYINAAEGAVQDAGREGSAQERKAMLKEKVSFLAETVQTQRDRIAKLEASLKKGNGENSKLMSLINMMKSQLEEKEQIISQMRAELENKNADIEQLTATVSNISRHNEELTTTVANQQKAMTEQTNQMNEAFVKVATKKELKALGILESGFLKKTKVNAANIDKNIFQKVDMRSFSEITIASKSPKVISQIPADSYTLTQNGDVTVLRITDPSKFWSVSNVLIIQQ